MKKRTNVVLDDELLEEARRLSGERTYSATINRALTELVKKEKSNAAAFRLMEMISKGGVFREGYLQEIRPNAYMTAPPAKKVSANEKRAPRVKSRSRGAR